MNSACSSPIKPRANRALRRGSADGICHLAVSRGGTSAPWLRASSGEMVHQEDRSAVDSFGRGDVVAERVIDASVGEVAIAGELPAEVGVVATSQPDQAPVE
jgi:hypothetical protein